MARVRGANALLNAGFESVPGTPPSGNWYRLPFVSSDLGEERGLIESDLLGQGREPFDPSYDVANDAGDLVVPVDTRNLWYWLKLMFGAPTSGNGDPASGTISFSAQPVADSTVTINGTAFTFKASGATGNQVNIGANTAATVTALAGVLNASGVSQVSAATYAANGTELTITHDTATPAGNSFTIAAGAGSNGTASGATLSGGTYSHVFTSGAMTLPSMAIELVHPELAKPYHVHKLVRGGTMRIGMTRRGLLNATLGLVAQAELDPSAASVAGTPTARDVSRLAQAAGEVLLDSVTLGNVVSSDFSYSNGLDLVETIRPDGRIEDADAGMGAATGNLVMRFADHTLLEKATSGTPVAIVRRWTSAVGTLSISTPRVFLPRFKRPVGGPAGLQVTANVQAAKPSGAPLVTATLKNDVAGGSY
jgi:hypothetical protein